MPAALVGVGLALLALFVSKVLGDTRTLSIGFGTAWLSFTTGRVLAKIDRPRGRGIFLRHILTGLTLGFVGATFLKGVFIEGPGWPWTPWFVLFMGFGSGLLRSHRALLRQARESDASAKRWLGVFHPKDIEALAILLAGYLILGAMGFLVLRAFSGLIPGSERLLAIAAAMYGLRGARYLLAFASEERGAAGAGFVGWMKAHALQNGIVILLLVGYASFRDDLAGALPFFPLVEFGLGMAVFGFVLARLRARFKRDGAALSTASTARDHERVVTVIRETEHDTVARPVARFLETGVGQREYADALVHTLPLEDARAAAVRDRLAQHHEPPRPPAIPMEWGFAAGAAMSVGLALAAFMLGAFLLKAEMPYPFQLALLFAGFGLYAQQDTARAHFRPWLALGIAAAGSAMLFLDFLFFAATLGSIAGIPRVVWWIVITIMALMIGIPAASSWRQAKRLQAGPPTDARKLSPALEVQAELQRTRKRAATMMTVAFTVLLPLPWFVDWLAGRGIAPADFPPFLDDVLAAAIWVIAAFGSAALIRFYGLTRGRPAIIAREKAKRDRRLAIHKDLMRTLDRS